MKLRDHQTEIIQTMQHKCGQILVPTGGGKTMCMIMDAEMQFSMLLQTIIVDTIQSYRQQLCEEF